MKFEELYENNLKHTLEALLICRLENIKAFNKVETKRIPSGLSIRWFGNDSDPHGDNHFSERVIPFNFKHVSQEIERQYYKLCNKR